MDSNLILVMLLIVLLNFILSSLTLGILILRDWDTKVTRAKKNKNTKVKILKVTGVILISLLLLIFLDIVIAYYLGNLK